jgi:CubicO group peptidase (beta-lactamase class C family)
VERTTPAGRSVDSRRLLAFLDDVEAAGLELHSLILWRSGAFVAEAWRWPYSPDRLRITHSMTKSFTACAIGLLIEDGKLALADKVADFFPEIDLPADSAHRRMSVEDLLTMRTGHAAEVSGAVWRGIPTSWIAEFFSIPIVHEPGSHYLYSSAASYMLSAIVTRVTGESMRD